MVLSCVCGLLFRQRQGGFDITEVIDGILVKKGHGGGVDRYCADEGHPG
jgi:hypothetical protein